MKVMKKSIQGDSELSVKNFEIGWNPLLQNLTQSQKDWARVILYSSQSLARHKGTPSDEIERDALDTTKNFFKELFL